MSGWLRNNTGNIIAVKKLLIAFGAGPTLLTLVPTKVLVFSRSTPLTYIQIPDLVYILKFRSLHTTCNIFFVTCNFSLHFKISSLHTTCNIFFVNMQLST